MEWVKRPGIHSCYLLQYLAWYLFLKQAEDQEMHCFFKKAAKLYPLLQTTQTSSSPEAPPRILRDEDYHSDENTEPGKVTKR